MESYLVKGDINGIQNFIYNVYEGEGGVAKILRARSFYISILSDVIIEYVKDIMDKEWECKTILNGGGGFIMEITPKQEGKEEEFKERLEDVRKNVEEFLLKKLYGEIGITFGYLKGKNEEINLNKLYERVDEEKKGSLEKPLPMLQRFQRIKRAFFSLKNLKRMGRTKGVLSAEPFLRRIGTSANFAGH